ncbi:MAG: ParB/RepB/Spo0J family partition protein [Rickettsiales bacterium]|nr:ParB/RepB/Spo0J family partition protein [Rickettsiales bacterium]
MTKKKKISSYFEKHNILSRNDDIKLENKNDTTTIKKYSKYHLYDSPDTNDTVVLEINPSLVSNWKFHDRPEEELGNIEALANDIKTIGQQQPCIVRLLQNNPGIEKKYEIIAGERRWRASMLANIPLKVIVKELDDSTAALIQIAENENRKNLSDFARASSLEKLISNNILRQIDLVSKLNKSKQYISSLLSYKKIPTNVYQSIGNFTKVSASLAEKIKQLSLKGEDYQKAIIDLGDRISQGKFGKSSLESAILKKINNDKKMTKKIHNQNGRHIFSLLYYKKTITSIQFTKIGRNQLLNNINVEDDDNELINTLKNILNN